MTMLDVSMLGQFEVRLDGEPVELTSRPLQLLLAYLMLHAGRRLRREKVAGILWPDSLESTARKNLRNYVWRLRKAIGEEYVTADKTRLTFNDSAAYRLDVELLNGGGDEVGTEALIEAVSAYRGELLPGFYEDWVQLERERQRAVFEQRMQQLLEQLTAESRWSKLVTWSEHWIASGQTPEPAYRSLMTGYAGLGDLAGVATSYRRCKKALAEDLGVEPSTVTRELYERLSQEEKPAGKGIMRIVDEVDPSQQFVAEELLAVGGQGEVYRGRDPSTGQAVVIKRLRSDLVSRQPELVKRLKTEGLALRQLNHPNIVSMLAMVEQEDQINLVMEYVPGGTLREILDQERQMSVGRTLDITLELADALSRAHHINIIHRDLKPANVLLATDGTPRLTDFGLALIQDSDSRLTPSHTALGSPAYMSPEALQGKELDARSDIWSFGVLLFEMLAGQRPFEGEQIAVVLNGILSNPAPNLGGNRPDLPPALVDLQERLLTKDPERRLSSMRQVAAELEAIRAGRDPDRIPITPVRQALAGKGAKTKAPQHDLPLPTTPFIGREKELADLRQLIVDAPANPIVSLVGPGGVGKTRLAMEAAAMAAEIFADGIYFVPLAPLSDAGQIPFTIAQSIQFRFFTAGDADKKLLDYLSDKQMLLILDNFEHLQEGANLLLKISRSAPGVKLLVPSRERLGLVSEVTYNISGLRYPPRERQKSKHTASELADYGAVQLLQERAKVTLPGRSWSDGDLEFMARICRQVQGMPLAIILAAGWLQVLTLEEIAGEISESLDILESQDRDLPKRQRSVRAAFQYSWQWLADGERDVFMKLAIFRGGFTKKAARAVTGADLRILRILADKSLVTMTRPDRYEVHELLRQFAEEQLVLSEASIDTRDAHSATYLDMLAQLDGDLKGGRQVQALDEIETDFENVLAAVNWALASGFEDKLSRAMDSLLLYTNTRNRYLEGSALFERIADGTSIDSQLRGQALARFCIQSSYHLLEYEHLQAYAEESLKIAERHKNERDIAFAHLSLGIYQTYSGDPFTALRHYEESLKHYRDLNDRYYEAFLVQHVGYIYGAIFDSQKFLEYMSESLELGRQIEDKHRIAYASVQLGVAHLAAGNYAEAEDLFRETLALTRELGDQSGVAVGSSKMALARYLQGDLAQTRALAGYGRSLSSELEIQIVFTDAMTALALEAAARGEYQQSLSLCAESNVTSSANPIILLQAIWAQSMAYAGLGDTKLGWQYLVQALYPIMNFGVPSLLTWLLPVAAVLLAQMGQESRAVEMVALLENHPTSPKGYMGRWEPYAKLQAMLVKELDPESYERAWQRGLRLDIEKAAEELLAVSS